MHIPSLRGFLRRKVEETDYWFRSLSDQRSIERISVGGHTFRFKCVTRKERARVRGLGDEPTVLQFLLDRVRDGDIFLDVGANIGFYAVVLSALTGGRGLAVALEPDGENYARLRLNSSLNPGRVLSLPIALSDRDGIGHLKLHSSDAGEGAHAIVASAADGVPVPMMTFDAMLSAYELPPPTHLKIDVEGYEESVLRGMTSFLGRGSLKSAVIEIHYFVVNGQGRQALSHDESIARRDRVVKALTDAGLALVKEEEREDDGLRSAHACFERRFERLT